MGSLAQVVVWRGAYRESVHQVQAVVCAADGTVEQAWGAHDTVILPRSSSKMIQALPLVNSGAADQRGLTDEHLALACASHKGAAIHTDRVRRWLADLALGDGDLRCGPQLPTDKPARTGLIRADHSPCQYHNNCSGKHTGFLTLGQHLGAGPDYIDPDHPVQIAVRAAQEDITGEDVADHAIDGCSAPNLSVSLRGLATAMARFATAKDGSAPARLRNAMMAYPALVAGEGRACTELMRAAQGQAALKTGAEGVFVAILPGLGKGIALKALCGTTRAAEAVVAALLVRLGVLAPDDPAVLRRVNAPILNRRDLVTGHIRVEFP
ncbi:asparaginase [Actibacterium sp. 188UL27-1]|uniref:asparaginase n=1 Tax=Actibacterium sp. 188UL27-1 TaxID=2786961 RepID=UPI00195D5038|nr:asparaginase [Actibacterium sp. 188UL27-1]MBM7070111.1 asparaginase [Actibacterium sp. 188UL27-1]